MHQPGLKLLLILHNIKYNQSSLQLYFTLFIVYPHEFKCSVVRYVFWSLHQSIKSSVPDRCVLLFYPYDAFSCFQRCCRGKNTDTAEDAVTMRTVYDILQSSSPKLCNWVTHLIFKSMEFNAQRMYSHNWFCFLRQITIRESADQRCYLLVSNSCR